MASKLILKVYDADGQMIAACMRGEEAAAVCAINTGSVIKFSGRIVWREGKEETHSADSYDSTTSTVYERIRNIQFDAFKKATGKAHPQDARRAS